MDTENESYYIPKSDTLFGCCTLQVKIENEEDYEKWKKYNGGRNRWDFQTSFPAVMQAEYDFHTSLDVDIISRKIIQLLQMGFNVRAANWRLAEYKSQLEKEKDI
jgi:hypothetical protein